MTALSIVQEVCGRQSLQVPTAAFSSVDAGVIQIRSLMNQSGRSLSRRNAWQDLATEVSFTTVAAASQAALPSDFGWITPETMFNRTQDRKVSGPLNASQWQRELSGSSLAAPSYFFRIRGNAILFTPTPSAGDSVYYEYVSKNWAASNGGTPISAMAADDDVTVLDEELIILDTIWRYRKAKGFDYSEEFRTLELEVEKAIGRDGGARTLSLGRARYWSYPNVPEGNFPG